MRPTWILLVALGIAGCSSGTTKFDSGDNGGNTSAGGAGTAGTTGTGSTTGSSGSSGSSGSTTYTGAPGGGSYSGSTVFINNGNEGRVLSASAQSVTAVLIEQQLPTAQLCDGHVLEDLQVDGGDHQAVFVLLRLPGSDGGIPADQYDLGTDGGYLAEVAYADGFGGTDPSFAPMAVSQISVPGSGSVLVSAYDPVTHEFHASFNGSMALLDGGTLPFTGSLDGYACP